MSQFATGLITTDFLEHARPPFIGKNWRLVYRVEPQPRHHMVYGRRVVRGREIIIEAQNQVVAQKVISLIHGALLLLWNGPFMADLYWRVEEVGTQKIRLKSGGKALFQLETGEIPVACGIAAKLSFNRRLTYAVHKFVLSHQVYAPDLRSLDPSEGIHHPLSSFPEDHVRFSYAIIAAYSVIEELALEPRTFPPGHPSTIVKGVWDPYIKNELENRLKRAEVDLNDKVLWLLRGTKTRIEKHRPPRRISKQKWARGPVRDVQVEVIDAIADASWLRSKISSHRFSTKVAALSVYDVANVQHLARRMLLERLGFWRYNLKRQKKPPPTG